MRRAFCQYSLVCAMLFHILGSKANHVFFYVHWVVLVATWSLPPATFNYQNCQNSQKCVQRLSRSLPQLPATTKIVQISKSVYWVANYHQLPSATNFFF